MYGIYVALISNTGLKTKHAQKVFARVQNATLERHPSKWELTKALVGQWNCFFVVVCDQRLAPMCQNTGSKPTLTRRYLTVMSYGR